METKLRGTIPKYNTLLRTLNRHKSIYVLLLPAILTVFIFNYLPLPGLLVSFMDYDYFKGFSSPFVGLANFKAIFSIAEFKQSILNTLTISVLNLAIVFPLPVVFALMLNELSNLAFKRTIQTVSYLPHFLSWIAIIGLTTTIYGEYGSINDLRVWLLGPDTQRKLFLTFPELFVPNVIGLTIWKELGWSSIIYLSAISGVDACLYEAARIDGANKFKQCLYVTVPAILPTVVMLFILKVGNLFASNFDLIYGLQNVYVQYEVISTTVFKQGITQGNYSIATAFGFVQGLISLVLVLITNYLSRRVNDISIL